MSVFCRGVANPCNFTYRRGSYPGRTLLYICAPHSKFAECWLLFVPVSPGSTFHTNAHTRLHPFAYSYFRLRNRGDLSFILFRVDLCYSRQEGYRLRMHPLSHRALRTIASLSRAPTEEVSNFRSKPSHSFAQTHQKEDKSGIIYHLHLEQPPVGFEPSTSGFIRSGALGH